MMTRSIVMRTSLEPTAGRERLSEHSFGVGQIGLCKKSPPPPKGFPSTEFRVTAQPASVHPRQGMGKTIDFPSEVR